jgi:hypothetical protein
MRHERKLAPNQTSICGLRRISPSPKIKFGFTCQPRNPKVEASRSFSSFAQSPNREAWRVALLCISVTVFLPGRLSGGVAGYSELMAVGFAPRSADHVAGFMALDWTRGAHIGYVLSGAGNNDVRQFTLARPRILVPYNGFSIRSATAVLSDAGATCHAELSVVYQGYREVTPILSSQKGWFVLPSNNYLESLILQKIVDQLPADSGGTKPGEPAAQATAAAPPKPEPANEKPTTPPPLKEPPLIRRSSRCPAQNSSTSSTASPLLIVAAWFLMRRR